MNFSLGCDPEMFLRDAAGALIASCDRIGGSKEFPLPLPIGDGFAVQEDNVAIEYNIPPSSDQEAFVSNVAKAMTFLRDMVAQQGLHITPESSAVFPDDQLQHPAALVFGCDPDYDAWKGGAQNPKPKADNPNLRSCGGHIHIGLEGGNPNSKETCRLIQLMDLHAGVPATILDAAGARRRQLYGKKGAFRPKVYGAEYRTLSNFWVHDPKLTVWAYQATQKAIQAWVSGASAMADEAAITAAVDHGNTEAAQHLITKYQLTMV